MAIDATTVTISTPEDETNDRPEDETNDRPESKTAHTQPEQLQLRPYQVAGVEWIVQHQCRIILADQMGTGKVQPLTSMVLTHTGWVRNGDLKLGDQVIGSDGKPHTVTGIYPQGVIKVWEVEFTDGSVVECGAEHLWAVNTPLRKWCKQPNLVMTTRELLESGLYYEISGKRKLAPTHNLKYVPTHNLKYFIPVMQPAQFEKKDFPIDPYVLGGLLSENKFIPQEYLFGSIAQREELLQGLLDTDGRASPKGAIQYYTVSPQLSKDFVALVQSLGGTCKVTLKPSSYKHPTTGEKVECQDHYRISVALPPSINPFRLARKAAVYQPRVKYGPSRGIKRVTLTERAEEGQCIAVDAPDCLYVTEHCVVTHNTATTLKTLRAALALSPIKTILVICPKVAFGVWEVEIRRWLRTERVTVWTGLPYERELKWKRFKEVGGFLITNYAQVGNLLQKCSRWGVVIVDEAHFIRNRKTKSFKNIELLQSAALLLLTGSPVVNGAHDLWALLHLVDPERHPHYWPFVNRYCHVANSGFGGGPKVIGIKDAPGLRAALAPYLLRRTKKQVLKDLPEKIRMAIPLEIEGEQRQMYDDIAKQMVADLGDDEFLLVPNRIAQIIRLRQILVSPALVGGVHKSAMFEAVKEAVQLEFDAGRAVIIFTPFAMALPLIEHELKSMEEPPDFLTTIRGGMKQGELPARVEQFQVVPTKRKVLLCSLLVGSSFTATAASTAFFMGYDWVPATNLQAEDRCIAEGQLVHVFEKGFIPIENVCVGDQVLTHLGNWKRVLRTSSKGYQGPMTSITYKRFGRPLTTTYDHKVLVKRCGGNPDWIMAHQVLPGDFLVMPRPLESQELKSLKFPEVFRHNPGQVNQFGAVQNNGRYKMVPDEIPVTPDLLYLFGRYLAEGCCPSDSYHVKGISIAGHIDERPELESLQATLKDSFGLVSGIYQNNYTDEENKGIELRCYSTELGSWFLEWFGHGAHNKHIPEELLTLPSNQCESLLQGYIDGDGYRNHNSGNMVEWVSVSPSLTSQMALLALRCGYSPTLREAPYEHNMGQWIGAYKTSNNAASETLKLADDRYVYQPVERVETYRTWKNPNGSGHPKVYDLTVEDDHSFVVGQASVHNCHRIGQRDSVLVKYFINRGTIDEYILRVVQQKATWARIALDHGARELLKPTEDRIYE